MREIKFRGWFQCINGQEYWVYGYLNKKKCGNWEITNDEYITFTVDNVGQFTGLRDKKGKEIYEGDICRTRDYGKYGNPNSELLICNDFNEFIYTVLFSEDHRGLNGYIQKEIEIIGNIHENKELLK